jgi:hypothetical protein
MATKNLIPQASGEGGIGIEDVTWGDAYFDSGHFNKGLYVSGVAVSTGDAGGLGGKWEDAATTGDVFYTGGNVGIGITTPSAKLHILGGDSDVRDLVLQYGGTSSLAEQNIVWKDKRGQVNASIGNALNGDEVDQPAGSINFRVGDGTSTLRDAMHIIPNGNVGIGITTPSAKLEVAGGINFSGNILPSESEVFDIGSASKKVRDLYLHNNSLHLGDLTLSNSNGVLQIPSGINLGEASLSVDDQGIIHFPASGIMVGAAEVKPDPGDPQSLYFSKTPQVQDVEGNPVTILTADKLGLGTSAVLENSKQDLQFKLLTDQERFVVGTNGEGSLASGWYRFNDFKVKGATDIGFHSINPADTRIYSDESSFILFKTDTAGNRVAHLVGGDEEVSANNSIALGIAIKVDSAESPEDIEFVHTDGESYSVINGNSDSLGTNGLPIRQGFQSPSLGSAPAPLLIDGGSF